MVRGRNLLGDPPELLDRVPHPLPPKALDLLLEHRLEVAVDGYVSLLDVPEQHPLPAGQLVLCEQQEREGPS